ncbi:MAG: FKBP-type peptidyl-prolyl cis-trans isomerase [Tannerella sp.]|jgi:FKBP-type peptidyl-prolyl cis-trans isomerase|nr:FKBP-type peptidyl-prolyl cis-trans isomerase [Tannerella sp.]
MKKISVLVTVSIMAISMITSCNHISTNVSLKTGADSAKYAIGVNYGAGLRTGLAQDQYLGDDNPEALIAGFLTALKGDSNALKLQPEEAQRFLQTYFMNAQAKEAESTKAEGDAFLAGNKGKDGIITTESGLQYKVITEGSGVKPTAEDTVKVHYTGKLLDGTEFDSSVTRGEPFTTAANRVIAGWTEVLQLMPVGSKYEVWIPSELGYGPQGAGQMIKPNSVLNFEIELLDVIKKK